MANSRTSTSFLLLVAAAVLLLLLSPTTSTLVPTQSPMLYYHKGELFTSPIGVYVLWYGSFPSATTATVHSFFSSFADFRSRRPSVASWWSTTRAYRDSSRRPVTSGIRIAGEHFDTACSLGKDLKRADIPMLVRSAVTRKSFPYDPTAVYLVLTAADVYVDRFCMDSCGFHSAEPVLRRRTGVVIHVGDSGTQCPGLCAWPYAKPTYGPPGPPLVAPNGVGVDGMIINIATLLAGAATNPRSGGYYEGDWRAPLEAATACAGMFGSGAYPGYPGKLPVDAKSKASYNAYGAGGRLFLLPTLWDPVTRDCKLLS